MSIPLKYLQCKGKIFLEPILDIANEASREVVVEHEDLSKTLEDPLYLDRVAAYEIQQLLDRPSNLYAKKTLENTIQYYGTDRDRVTGILYSYGHIR